MKYDRTIRFASRYHTYDDYNCHLGRNWVTTLESHQFVQLLAKREWKLDAVCLSADDSLRLADAIQLWCLLLRDMLNQESLTCYSRKGLIAWAFKLARYDLKSTVKQLKLALGILREDNASNGIMSYTEWKFWCKNLGLDHNLLGPVFELLRHFHKCQSVEAFRAANSSIQFMLRLTLCDIDQVEEALVDEYIEMERSLKSRMYPETLLSQLNEKAKIWLSDLDESYFNPRHSSGATASVRRADGYEMKYRDMPHSWLFGALEDTCESNLLSPDQIAVLGVVPKGIDKKRLISKETTVNQYFQQGIFRMLDHHFQVHSWMGIHLHKADLSMDLCQNASDQEWLIQTTAENRYNGLVEETTWEEHLVFSHNHGTLDLSSASDLNSWFIIERIFKDTPLEAYLATFRSKCVWIDCGGKSTMVGLEKFAPMGSATCFPVMCLVLSMVCDLARTKRRSTQPYLVYGDDIEVADDIWFDVIQMLEALGFKVNLEKSFAPEQAFKESCGMEAWFGHDVRPLRIPRGYDFLKVKVGTPTALGTLINFANAAYEKFPSLWAELISRIKCRYGDIGFGYAGGLIGARLPDVMTRRVRYNQQLDRYETWALTLKTIEYESYACDRLLRDLSSLMRDPAKVDFAGGLDTDSRSYFRTDFLSKQVERIQSEDINEYGRIVSEEIRYQHMLHQYQSTRRGSLLYPEDRITAAVGPSVTKLEWKWCPDEGHYDDQTVLTE